MIHRDAHGQAFAVSCETCSRVWTVAEFPGSRRCCGDGGAYQGGGVFSVLFELCVRLVARR